MLKSRAGRRQSRLLERVGYSGGKAVHRAYWLAFHACRTMPCCCKDRTASGDLGQLPGAAVACIRLVGEPVEKKRQRSGIGIEHRNPWRSITFSYIHVHLLACFRIVSCSSVLGVTGDALPVLPSCIRALRLSCHSVKHRFTLSRDRRGLHRSRASHEDPKNAASR